MSSSDHNIMKVKLLGIRTSEEGKLKGLDYGVYSLLVQYGDSHYEIIEVDYKDIGKYANDIGMWYDER